MNNVLKYLSLSKKYSSIQYAVRVLMISSLFHCFSRAFRTGLPCWDLTVARPRKTAFCRPKLTNHEGCKSILIAQLFNIEAMLTQGIDPAGLYENRRPTYHEKNGRKAADTGKAGIAGCQCNPQAFLIRIPCTRYRTWEGGESY